MSKSLKKAVNKRILIVSDTIGELNDVQNLLAEDVGSCLKVTNEEEGLQLFHDHHPSVLVLAFSEIESAEHFYLSLYKYDKQVNEVPHQTLLLCKSSEQRKAYRLCKSGTFDDYIADRPLYDPFRLRLSISQALKRRDQELYLYQLSTRVEKITDGLQLFDEFIGSRVTLGDGHHKETIREFLNFIQKLGTDLESLEQGMTTNVAGKTGEKVDMEAVSRQFQQFRDDSLQSGILRVVEQMNKSDGWLKELNSGYKGYVETVQKESLEIQNNQLMLVDDDDFYRDTLATMLQESGMHVVGVGDGKTALARLHYNKPKLILLDYKMPEMNGIETLKQIKLNPDTKSIPVIMLTGVSERELVAQCMRSGATDFIVKPGDRNTIISKINKAIKS